MKVTLLKKNPLVYSANAYFIRGDWNTIPDVNTLIDVGSDDYIIDEIEALSTGVGKRKLEQVILTHEHFDHAGGLHYIIEKYQPKVIAYSPSAYVTTPAYDGMTVKIGDREAVIIHTPGHSNDSICIYCEAEQVLFSGDTPLNVLSTNGTYISAYVESLERLSKLKIKTIYSGHDEPITENAMEIIKNTLKNVRKSKIID